MFVELKFWARTSLIFLPFTLLQIVTQRASNAMDKQENPSNVSDKDNAVKLAVNKSASVQTDRGYLHFCSIKRLGASIPPPPPLLGLMRLYRMVALQQ